MSQTEAVAPRARKVIHPVDEVLPPQKLALYGLQHVMAFYAGAVIVPILLAGAIHLTDDQLIALINADLFTCGIASIIQAAGFWKIGVKLPLLQGVTFTAVSPMISIGLDAGGGKNGLVTIYGSVLVAGLATFILAPYFSKLIKYFPPVVTGSVITIIGIALLPVAAGDATADAKTGAPHVDSGKSLAYALGVLLLIVLIQRIFKGFMATIAVLLGLVVGTIVAAIAGDASFDSVGRSDVVGVTTPFHFGAPKFAIGAIISMLVVMAITAVETTGDVFATGEIVEKRIVSDDIARAIRADGLATFIGGIFNSFPYTCFAENVGLVRLTRIRSRWVVVTAGVIMIVIGLIPKIGAVVASVPRPVLGGAALAMFATVAVVGIQTLSRVDFNDHRNIVIVGTSLALAGYVTAYPDVQNALPHWAHIFLGSGITIGSLTALLLNFVFHHLGKDYGPAVAGRPGETSVRLDQVNGMTKEQFVGFFGHLFQGPSWVAERAFEQRPFTDTDDLRNSFQEVLFSADKDEQRELMSFYPDLGHDAVGEHQAGEDSFKDQAVAGLTNLDDEDHAAFGALASAYREKFGVPLIISVRDIENKDQVLAQGQARLHNSPSQEHALSLIEMAKIARHRFEASLAEANPVQAARTQRFDNLG